MRSSGFTCLQNLTKKSVTIKIQWQIVCLMVVMEHPVSVEDNISQDEHPRIFLNLQLSLILRYE